MGFEISDAAKTICRKTFRRCNPDACRKCVIYNLCYKLLKTKTNELIMEINMVAKNETK